MKGGVSVMKLIERTNMKILNRFITNLTTYITFQFF